MSRLRLIVGASLIALPYLGRRLPVAGGLQGAPAGDAPDRLRALAGRPRRPALSARRRASRGRDPARSGPRSVHPVRRVLPLAVLAAASVFNYSLPGLLWVGAVGGAVLLARYLLVKPRPELPDDWLRKLAPYLIGLVVVIAVATAGEWSRIADFSRLSALNPDRFGSDLGNLKQALSPLEALGIWPAGEFDATATSAGSAGAALLPRCADRARGPRPRPLARAPGAGLDDARPARRHGRGLGARRALQQPLHRRQGAGDPLAGRDRDRPARNARRHGAPGPLDPRDRPRDRRRRARRSWSSARRRSAPTTTPPSSRRSGRSSRASRSSSSAATTSSAGSSPAPTTSPGSSPTSTTSRTPARASRRARGEGRSSTSTPSSRRRSTASATSSRRPAGPPRWSRSRFQEVERTDDYVLYERTGSTGKRRTLDEGTAPGAVLDCDTPEGRAVAKGKGTAIVWNIPPVIAEADGWQPSDSPSRRRPHRRRNSKIPEGGPLADLARVRQPPAAPRHRAPTSASTRRSPPTSTSAARRRPSRSPRSRSTARPTRRSRSSRMRPTCSGGVLRAPNEAHLRSLTATPLDPGAIQRVQVRQTCGKYVDWYRQD